MSKHPYIRPKKWYVIPQILKYPGLPLNCVCQGRPLPSKGDYAYQPDTLSSLKHEEAVGTGSKKKKKREDEVHEHTHQSVGKCTSKSIAWEQLGLIYLT